MTDAPSPWSRNLPRWQVVFDSTSLGWLKSCPALYRYQMIEHWRLKSTNVHLMFGQLYAKGCEFYGRYKAKGMDHNTATREMVRQVLMLAGTRDEEGVWHHWNPPPDHRDANIKNRYTLIRSLVWNVEDRVNSPLQIVTLASGKAAVELSFEFPAYEIAGETVSLAGHLDSIVENKDTQERWVSDDKTTKSQLNAQYWQGYSPNNQMSLYSVAGRIIAARPLNGVLVRAAHLMVEGTRFATQQVTRPPQVLEEWLEDTEYYIQKAREYAVNDRWPRNDSHCGQFGGCPFQKVCSRIPTHRPAWLRDDFNKVVWDPSQSRGDI